MKLMEWAVFGVRQPELDRIVLNKRERDTLRNAARLLDDIRNARNSRVPQDWYAGDEDDADLCFGWRICDDLARDGYIDAEAAR